MTLTQDAFRSTVETHQKMVFSIALRITGEYGTAEDVAQEVFLELYRTAAAPQGDDHTRYWLRRVAVHRSTDALRRRALRPESIGEPWLEEEHAPIAGLPSAPHSVGPRLEELLDTLPEAQRVAIVLRYTEQMEPADIATLLNQPLATVKSNLQRGLALLRRKAAVTLKTYVRP